jgi:hypothetical protein
MESKTMKVYKLILKKINGWTQEDIDKLSSEELLGDPLLDELKKIIEEPELNIDEVVVREAMDLLREKNLPVWLYTDGTYEAGYIY